MSPSTPQPAIAVAAAKPVGGNDENGVPRKVVPGVHRVMIEYNFDPSRRLRFYQFDPLHHDVAIYSIH